VSRSATAALSERGYILAGATFSRKREKGFAPGYLSIGNFRYIKLSFAK